MLDTPTFSAEDRDQSAALTRLAEARTLLKNEQPELLNFFEAPLPSEVAAKQRGRAGVA